jgi:hypothetical protein
MKMPREEMTKRIITAMENKNIDIVSHPTGRLIQKREEFQMDLEKILKASKRLQQLGYFDKKVISIDVAREGDDMTQIYAWHGSKVVDEEHYGKKDLDVTAARAVIMQNKWGCNCICWDADGIGGGLMSNIKGLVSRGTKLIEFRGNGKSSNPMYYNQRAEAYYDLQELCMNDLLSFEMNKITPETISEISRIKSEYKLGKILVEDKAEIKKKFNKSPDQADALAYGAWALKRAPSMITEPAVGKGTMRELITQIDEKLEDELNNKYVIGNHNADRE